MKLGETLNFLWYLWKRNNWMLDPRLYWGNFSDVSVDRPIFLLGVQGGGLTLLARMLRRHPEVVSVSGNYRYWSGADEMHTVFGPLLPPELTGTRYKVPVADHPIYKPPRSWTYACDELLPYYRKRARDATPQAKQALERVIRYCVKRYGINGKARFVDKSQVYTVRVGLIRELLKEYEPRFVLVVNNPYAACYRAALGKAQDMKRLQKMLSFRERLTICAQHWANSVRCALEDKAADMLIVRFEDVLQAPETMLRQICAHVGLDFRPDMLPAPHHRIPFGTRFADRWYPLRLDRALAYIERATPEELALIHTYCGSLAEQFGYPYPQKGGGMP